MEKIISIFEHTEKYSANHSKNVSIIAHELGKSMGIKGKKLKDLRIAALLHDIGKVSIPKSILNKNGKLTKEEFEIVKKHPIYSVEIVNDFEELAHLSYYIKYHHERMDGSGYPHHLVGEDIPLISRVIAVADVFEALIGERPYRSPISPEAAIQLMRDEMVLDQQVLDVLSREVPGIYKKIKLSVCSVDKKTIIKLIQEPVSS